MITKESFIIIFSLVIITKIQAQIDNLSWFEAETRYDTYIGGTDDNYNYLFMHGKNEISLVKHDIDHNVTSTTPLDLKSDDKHDYIFQAPASLYADQLGIIFFHFEKPRDIGVYGAIIEKNGTVRSVNKLTTIPEHYTSKPMRRKTIGIKQSKDNSKWLVYYYYSPENGKQLLILNVFDQDFNLLWDKTEETSTKEYGKYDDPIVSNNGSVYIQTYRILSKAERAQNPHIYTVFGYGPHGTPRDPFVVKPTMSRVAQLKIETDDKSNLICSGLLQVLWDEDRTTTNGKPNSGSGVFFIKADPEGQTLLNSSLFLNEDFMDLKDPSGHSKDKDGIYINSYTPKDILMLPNGEYIMMAEYYFYNAYGVDNKNGTHTWEFHNFDNIMVFKFDNTGNMLWAQRIPKERKGEDQTYTYGLSDKHLYLVYNSDVKPNIDSQDRDRITDIRISILDIETGNFEEKSVEKENENVPKKIEALSCGQVGEKHMILTGFGKGGSYNWGLFMLE